MRTLVIASTLRRAARACSSSGEVEVEPSVCGISSWTTARACPSGIREDEELTGLARFCAIGLGAAEGEAGDVQFGLTQNGADAADDARNILVADDDQGAGEFGFDVDAIVAEQAWGVAVEDGGEACPCPALRRGRWPSCGSSGG